MLYKNPSTLLHHSKHLTRQDQLPLTDFTKKQNTKWYNRKRERFSSILCYHQKKWLHHNHSLIAAPMAWNSSVGCGSCLDCQRVWSDNRESCYIHFEIRDADQFSLLGNENLIRYGIKCPIPLLGDVAGKVRPVPT